MTSTQWTNKFDPYEFEEYVSKIWESKGYTTNVRKGSGDRGIDIEATKGNTKELIQVKLYSSGNKISSGDIRKYATLYQQDPNADNVVIVTSSSYTSEALKLAKDLNVRTINGKELEKIANISNVESYNPSIEKSTNNRKVGRTADVSHIESYNPSIEESNIDKKVEGIANAAIGVILFFGILVFIAIIISFIIFTVLTFINLFI